MKNASVRLGGISIHNFKNVLEGSLSFINTRKAYKASIVGLYGQNGSGKTALIDALELLKYVLCGRPIPEKFAEYINVDSESATLLRVHLNNQRSVPSVHTNSAPVCS